METTHAKRLLPPIPAPPHDPTWWLLDARAGWKSALLEGVERDPCDSALVLAPTPGSQRSLTEASGSFGGLTLPSHAALAPDGSVYLLDRAALALKRFASCICRFEIVPCFGGEGGAARRLQDPHGIGIRGDRLFLCDSGNHRLGVFALPDLVLLAYWVPPVSAGLPHEWTPHAVAFDRRGHVFVTDPANGYLHRFHPSGQWENGYAGFGAAMAVAIDCHDRIYVASAQEGDVRVVDTGGRPLAMESRVEALRRVFPRLPFCVDAYGHLHLSVLCPCPPAAKAGLTVAFDEHGDPIEVDAASTRVSYERDGLYISQALDSARYRCQWHRIVLGGSVPDGTSVRLYTYTAQVHAPDAHVLDLPESAWSPLAPALRVGADGWDGLIQSPPGRFLWLQMQLRGNGTATPRLQHIKVEFPRISLRRYLPAVFGKDAVGADFTDRLLSLFDSTFRSVEHQIDTQARLFDPLSAPAEKDVSVGSDFLTWLASWIGVTLDRHWPDVRRRQFLKGAARLFALRGTREGLWRQLLFYLGMEPEARCCPADQPRRRCRLVPAGCARPRYDEACAWEPPPLILEHYKLRRWLFLGVGRLGDQAVLWGQRIVGRSELDGNAQVGGTKLITSQDPLRDPFHVYAHRFSVFVPGAYQRSPQHRRALENLIQAGKPAHTQAHLIYVEPRFRIGFQSMIGLDSVVGCYPEGVTLGDSSLGQASVLGGKRAGPGARIDEGTRIGTTTI